MSIKRLSGAGLTTPKSNKLWDQTTFQSGMFALATIVVPSGGASSVTFSSIPSTYTHLQIRAIVRSTASYSESLLKMNFNSDTASNYAFHYVRGNGSATAAAGFSTQTHIRIDSTPEASLGTNVFAALVIDILDYANTNKAKTTRALTGYDSNGAGIVALQSGLWTSTAAINAISFDGTYDGGVNGQYSSFALYGIKSA